MTLRFHHYKHVFWTINGGPWGSGYHAVVVHDACQGCAVCQRSSAWFMEFARLARDLIGINLRDCLHWGHLADNPQPLIVPPSNLGQCNRETLTRLRDAYYRRPEADRPHLEPNGPHDDNLSQGQRFEDRLEILQRMIELWEDGQYIGWPS